MRQFHQLTQPPTNPPTFLCYPFKVFLYLLLSLSPSLSVRQQQLQHAAIARVADAVAGIFAFHVLHWQNRFKNAKNPLNYSKHKQAMIYGTETNSQHATETWHKANTKLKLFKRKVSREMCHEHHLNCFSETVHSLCRT